ncbi:MAG: CoA pyrophosphatase [Armatimonadota bacterium]|nr:CoA pyrophosphatase [Armatimonadota bacterium]MDR7426245.1 CoA pyrophosphatase [Armatimonadota bacterium]MDR7463286.1 CoA pyrophosphatase [Armatimonadota bacterium]MDR7468978.1 CoA pyrophosphatase [Armatimonadota bacterium]MDR7474025.1 CoA pyrophosphatase [Armatimonadota bacterium]
MASPLIEELKKRLASLPPAPAAAENLRRAAVLVPLFESGGEVHLLLTRRSQAVEHHKGQIAFPGGAADGDENLRQTALRETFEEVGLPPERVEILGRLPDVEVVASGFRVSPFVGVIPHPYPLRPSSEEIEEIVSAPLAVFRRPANLRVERRDRGGRRYEILHYTYRGHDIWGATARIIRHLVDLLEGA